MTQQVQQVINHCRETLGEPTAWKLPDGYPDSLALAVIDAVWSLGVRYGGVVNVNGRYRAYRASSRADADQDDLPDLLAVYQAVGGDEDFAARIGNHQKTSTGLARPARPRPSGRRRRRSPPSGSLHRRTSARRRGPTWLSRSRHGWVSQDSGRASPGATCCSSRAFPRSSLTGCSAGSSPSHSVSQRCPTRSLPSW